MKSLRDVLPMGSCTVILRQSGPEEDQIKVTVQGIELEHIGPLFAHFPELAAALSSKKTDAEGFAKDIPARALNAIIAAGCNVLGDQEQEEGIANLALFEKIALLVPILERTIGRDGPGPFVDLLRVLGVLPPQQEISASQAKAA